MPWGDGTGPMGYGPMTGRGAGYCAGYGAPGSMNPAGGRRFGGRGRGLMGRGGGFGRRNRFYATGQPGWARGGWNPAPGMPAAYPNREQELELLEQQARYFNEALEDIKQRIEDLSTEKKT